MDNYCTQRWNANITRCFKKILHLRCSKSRHESASSVGKFKCEVKLVIINAIWNEPCPLLSMWHGQWQVLFITILSRWIVRNTQIVVDQTFSNQRSTKHLPLVARLVHLTNTPIVRPLKKFHIFWPTFVLHSFFMKNAKKIWMVTKYNQMYFFLPAYCFNCRANFLHPQ